MIGCLNTINIHFDPHIIPDRFIIHDGIIDPNDYTYDDYINGDHPIILFDSGWVCDFPAMYPAQNVTKQLDAYLIDKSLFTTNNITIVILSWLDDYPGWIFSTTCS